MKRPLTSSEAASYPRPLYAWYVVGVLLTANLCCYLARMMLILLVQPINRDLHLSDTQMSLLQGAAFSIFFVLAGLPIGWLADRSGRRNIVICAVVTWSVMTVFCGLASSYGELFLARIGVGIGEAALTPAVFSMIADYFPARRRGRAMAVFYMGALFGTSAATIGGGMILRVLERGAHVPLLAGLAPWQALFCLAAAPGFLVAALLLTVREPARHEALPLGASASPSFGILRFLAGKWRAFLPLYLSLTIIQFCAFAVTAWVIPLLVRRDHMTTPAAGATYGVMVTAIGFCAAVFGGVIGDHLGATSRFGGRFRAVIYSYVIFVPGVLLLALATTPLVADAGLVLEVFGVCISASMMYTVLQDIVPNQFRGQAVAILSMLVTLVGATLGPTAVALFTDLLFHDQAKVGYSILLVALPSVVVGLALTLAGLGAYGKAARELHGGAERLSVDAGAFKPANAKTSAI